MFSDWFPVTEYIRRVRDGDRTLFHASQVVEVLNRGIDKAEYITRAAKLLESQIIVKSGNGFVLSNGVTTKATYDYKLKYTLLDRVMQTYGGSYSECDYKICVTYWNNARLLANNLVEILQSDRTTPSLEYAITRHREILQRKVQGLEQLVDGGHSDDPTEIGMPRSRLTYILQDLAYVQQQIAEYSENAQADRNLLNECVTKIKHLSAVLLDAQYQKSVVGGYVTISCKTGEQTIPVTRLDIHWSKLQNVYIDAVVHIVKLLTDICSMTVAGPLKGYMLGFRFHEQNDTFLNKYVYNNRIVTFINDMINLYKSGNLQFIHNNIPVDQPHAFLLLLYTIVLIIRCPQKQDIHFHVHDDVEVIIQGKRYNHKQLFANPLIYQPTNLQLESNDCILNYITALADIPQTSNFDGQLSFWQIKPWYAQDVVRDVYTYIKSGNEAQMYILNALMCKIINESDLHIRPTDSRVFQAQVLEEGVKPEVERLDRNTYGQLQWKLAELTMQFYEQQIQAMCPNDRLLFKPHLWILVNAAILMDLNHITEQEARDRICQYWDIELLYNHIHERTPNIRALLTQLFEKHTLPDYDA